MNLTDEEYAISALFDFIATMTPDIAPIAIEAMDAAATGQQFDANIQAALDAAEWLDDVFCRYNQR